MQHKVSLAPARSQLPPFVTSEQPQQAQPVLSPGHWSSSNTEQVAAALKLLWLQGAEAFWLLEGLTCTEDGQLCLEYRACASRDEACAVMGRRPFGILIGTGRCSTAASQPGQGEGKTSNQRTPALMCTSSMFQMFQLPCAEAVWE